MKLTRLFLMAMVLVAGCASNNFREPPRRSPPPPPPPVEVQIDFQHGQTLTVLLDQKDIGLRNAFISWAKLGVYRQTPVYRQLPGIFVLTGKPRLAGRPFVQGQFESPGDPKNPKKPPETKAGQIGLVMHPDGSVGPEIILMYGMPLASCCETPLNIRIGTITAGRFQLGDVQRGDNLFDITVTEPPFAPPPPTPQARQ